MVFAQQRHRQQRTKARLDDDVADAALIDVCVHDVADFHRLVRHGESPDRALALADTGRAQRRDELIGQPFGGVQVEHLGRFVVLMDGAAVHAGELRGPRHDRREHGLQIQRRADGLSDLAQRLQFADRSHELAGPRLELLEQAHVLDGDHGLVGEGPQQRDLFFGERPGFRAGPR